jgi:hypothetical protein
MLQIVNFFLEKPDKLGKTFTLILQLLLTVWFTNGILILLDLIKFSNTNAASIWSLSFVENISLISIICYLLTLAACWFLLWYLAPLLVIIFLYVFNGIIRLPFKKVLIWLGYIIYGSRWLLFKCKVIQEPYKFWKQETAEVDSFSINQQELWGLLDVIRKMDKFLNRPTGSMILLKFLDADLTGSAMSTIHKYYQIVLMAFVGGVAFSDKLSNGLLVTMIVILSLFSLLIVAFMDFLDRIHSTDSSHARQRAEATIRAYGMAQDIRTSYLGQFYHVEHGNYKVNLKLKREEDKNSGGFFRPDKITFILAHKASQDFLDKWFVMSQRIPETEHLAVLVSDVQPSTVSKNLIESKNYGFIFQSPEFPFKESLPKIRTFLLSNPKTKPE